jgi:predicted dehydrogenase
VAGLAKLTRKAAERYARARARRGFEERRLERELRVGVFGTGKAGRYHLEALSRIGGAKLVCLVNRGRTDPAPLLGRYGVPEAFASVEEAIGSCSLDAAIVAVSSVATAGVAARLMENRIACLIEKPLAVRLEDAAHLRDLAAKDPLPHAVGYNRRWFGCVRSAHDWVRALGSPYSIHVEASEEALALARGAKGGLEDRLLLNTTHFLDLFTLFGGAFESVGGLDRRKTLAGQPVDFVNLIRFRGGCSGSFVAHWRSPGARTATLYGPDYRIDIDLESRRSLLRAGKKLLRSGGSDEDLLFKPGVYLQDFHFLDAVARRAPLAPPSATIEEGYETARLGHAIQAAAH